VPLPFGPLVTYFGLVHADGRLDPREPVSFTPDGVPIYACRSLLGFGFRIVVEGRPGSSGAPVGAVTFNSDPRDPSARPDIQIQANRDLGNGSTLVCDTGGPAPTPSPGGVPKIDPPSFAFVQEISDRLNDFGCRFEAFRESDFSCTLAVNGAASFVSPQSTMQFCALVSKDILTFPPGDTLLTVRLRDVQGNVGNEAKILVRVGSPQCP